MCTFELIRGKTVCKSKGVLRSLPPDPMSWLQLLDSYWNIRPWCAHRMGAGSVGESISLSIAVKAPTVRSKFAERSSDSRSVRAANSSMGNSHVSP